MIQEKINLTPDNIYIDTLHENQIYKYNIINKVKISEKTANYNSYF